MKQVSDDELKRHFLAWQCRIRQLAMRQQGGRPSPGMTPKVLDKNGSLIMEAMIFVLALLEPDEHTKFFQFQVQKSPDPKQSYDAALKVFQGDYFQKPDCFSGRLAAQFAPHSTVAERLLEQGECILEFAQYSQVWKLNCEIRRLTTGDPVCRHVLAHNRIFNRNIPADATVLAFAPSWHSAYADPAP